MKFIFIIIAALMAMPTIASTRYLPQQQMKHHELFLSRIQENLQRPDINGVVSRLSDLELADLVTLYGAASGGRQHELVTVLGNRISNAQMTRLSSAFNQPTTLMQSAPKGATVNGPEVTLDMSIYEVYLEFRTATVGSLSVGASMAQTAMYTAGWVSAAWGAGYTAGTGAAILMERYMPGTWEGIGNTIGAAVNGFNSATNFLAQGSYQQQIDATFGGTISIYGRTHSNYNTQYNASSPDYSGDFSVASAFDYRMDANYFSGGMPSCRIRHCSQF